MAQTKVFWSRHKNLRIGDGAAEARFSNGLCTTSNPAVIATLSDKKKAYRFGIVDVTNGNKAPEPVELQEVGDLKTENRSLKEKLEQQENSIKELKEMVEALKAGQPEAAEDVKPATKPKEKGAKAQDAAGK